MTSRPDDSSADGRPLARLPKAHLHLHLSGTMRPSTLDDLARRHRVEVPAPVREYPSFDEFVSAYSAAHAVLRQPDELARLVAEMVEDAAADGAVWLEPSLSLRNYRAITGSDAATLEVVLEAAHQATERFGVGVGLIVAAERGDDPEEAEQAAALAARYAGGGVVGFGLGGDERHPPGPFIGAFALAREAGLLAVPHAGELGGPDSVRATLDHLRPRRIMHGVRVSEDVALVERLRDEGVCLDICPSSNRSLGVVDDLSAHPLASLIRAGLSCSINADAPLPFQTTLGEEYERCRRNLGLTDGELAAAARASIEASAAPSAVVVAARTDIASWIGGDPLAAR